MLRGAADRSTRVRAMLAVGLAASVVALVGLGSGDPSIADRAAFTVIPAAMVIVVAMAATGARDLVVAGVLMAAAPSIVWSIAAGQSVALLGSVGILGGVVAASRGFARLDPGIRTLTTSSAGVVLTAAWVVATPTRNGPAPDWHEVVSQTGESLRRTIVGVGVDGRTIALAALLIWVLGAGLLVGVALLADRPWLAAVVPIACAVAVLGTWSVERWRGPVEAGSAMWLVSAAVAFTAASITSHATLSARVARALVVLAAFVLGLGIVHHVRRAGGSDVRLVGGVIAASVTGVAAWWAASVAAMHNDGEPS